MKSTLNIAARIRRTILCGGARLTATDFHHILKIPTGTVSSILCKLAKRGDIKRTQLTFDNGSSVWEYHR